jgi:hypothetical protein
MVNDGDKKHWTDERVYGSFIILAGAANIALTIMQGMSGLGPLAGSALAQLGVIMGGGVVGALVTKVGRDFLSR